MQKSNGQPRRWIPEEVKQRVMEQLNAGRKPAKHIARENGVSYSTVRWWKRTPRFARRSSFKGPRFNPNQSNDPSLLKLYIEFLQRKIADYEADRS